MALQNVLVKINPVQDIIVDATTDIEKNQPYFAHSLHGVISEDAKSGESVAMDVSARTWQLNLTGLTVAKGDSLYITTGNVLTTTKSSNRWFGTVVSEQDSNGIADVLIAPQTNAN